MLIISKALSFCGPQKSSSSNFKDSLIFENHSFMSQRNIENSPFTPSFRPDYWHVNWAVGCVGTINRWKTGGSQYFHSWIHMQVVLFRLYCEIFKTLNNRA